MRIAGIELEDGARVWSDVGELELDPLERVVVETRDGPQTGWVFAAPADIVSATAEPSATVVARVPAVSIEARCDRLPGAEMPPLGTRFRTQSGEGTIVRIDPIEKRVTVRMEDGDELEIALSPNAAGQGDAQ